MSEDGRRLFAGKRGRVNGAVIFVSAAASPGVYHSRCVNGRAAWMRGAATEAAVMLAAALLLALLGPFGSWAIPFPARLVDWLVFAVGGYACFRPVVWAAQVLANHTRLPLALALVFAGAVAALPTTLVVAWGLTGMAVSHVSLAALADLYPEVLLVGLLVTAAQVVLGRRSRVTTDQRERTVASAPSEPEPTVARASAMPFLDRLPPALGTDLIALEQEDHYLRAHTALGSTLILMRMRDAAVELAAIDGARVHRSWWVARGAVSEVVRRDRTVALKLTNGLEAPVARAAVPELRASGWFDPLLAAQRLPGAP